MNNPLEISFRGIDPSRKIENLIREKVEKIVGISNDVVKCHVILEKLSQHHQKGNAYCVRLDLKLAHFPDIVVTEESKEGELPLASAVREAFKRAHGLVRRQIDRRRKKVPRPDKEGEPLLEEALEEE